MKKYSVFILTYCLILAACNNRKEFPTFNIFDSSLEQLLTHKQPIDLYVFKFGRFMIDSRSTLSVRRDDITKEFTGFSTLEMDKRGSFKIMRKAFFQDHATEVTVIGSQALYRDRLDQNFKSLYPDPEFLNWARTAVGEIFSTYDQTDFADSAQLDGSVSEGLKCYKNASGNLCLDKETSLPMSGKYRVNVSGDKTTDQSTTLDLEFKIVPHPQSTELMLFPDKQP